VKLSDQPVDAINLQPVGHPWSISVFKLHFLLVRILNVLPQVLYSQPLLKDSYWFYSLLYCDLLAVLQNIFSVFHELIECFDLLQLADASGIGHMTRTISLD